MPMQMARDHGNKPFRGALHLNRPRDEAELPGAAIEFRICAERVGNDCGEQVKRDAGQCDGIAVPVKLARAREDRFVIGSREHHGASGGSGIAEGHAHFGEVT